MKEENKKNFQDSLYNALNLFNNGMRPMMLLKKFGILLMVMKDK